MRLYLINPSNSLVSIVKIRESRWNRYRVWKPLSLMVLAGMTSPEWEITIVDENLGAPHYPAMPRPDLVGITAFTSQAGRAYEIAAYFRNLGVPVINAASAIERSVDKYYTSFILADTGISTPRSLVTEDFYTALEFCREMGDVVIKPLFGSEGKGMVRISDDETAYRVLRAWELNRYVYYIQEYVPHFQEDIRAFVIGGKVAATMRRISNGWKTNYSRGAEVTPVELSGEMGEMALKAVQVIGLDYAGVDLMKSEDGRTYVTEINSIPGWQGLQKITREDIPGRIVDHVLEKLNAKAQKRKDTEIKGT